MEYAAYVPVVLASFLPGIIWLVYFSLQSRYHSVKKLALFFTAGMCILIPAACAERLGNPSRFVLLTAAAPIVEETLKACCTMLLLFFTKSRLRDSMIVAATVALGFAAAENVYMVTALYAIPHIMLGRADHAYSIHLVWKLYVIRALLTVPAHALWSGIWGYALGKTGNIFSRRCYIFFIGFSAAVVLHALYNLMLFHFPPGALGMMVMVPILWYWTHRMLKRARIDV